MKTQNDWTQTFTGNKFHFLNPDLESIDIKDIAHALSMNCRFNGHTNKFYSVAQHSIHVAYLMAISQNHLELVKKAFLHDAAEAYVCDLPKPIKHMKFMKKYRETEDNILKKINIKFKINPDFNPDIIKEKDLNSLAIEMKIFMSLDYKQFDYLKHFHIDFDYLYNLNHKHAKKCFLKAFRLLFEEEDGIKFIKYVESNCGIYKGHMNWFQKTYRKIYYLF